jgi:hypothetical protein
MRARLAIQIAALALAAVLPSFGQETPPETWHFGGELGADFSSANNTQLFSPSPSNPTTEYETVGGDLSLFLSGFLKDPKFLSFSTDFNGDHGSNAVALGGYRDSAYGGGFDASFLPDRPFPFHVFFRKSQYGTAGTGFGQNADTSSFGFDWALREPNLPHVGLHFLKESNEVQLPTSLTNSSYRLNELGITASDDWKGWKWNGGFTDFGSTNSAAESLALPTAFEEGLKAQSLFVSRTFWDDKARFNFDDRLQWQQEQFRGQPAGRFTDAYVTSRLYIDHTPKLSSNYFYSFTRITQDGETSSSGAEGAGSVSFISLPPVTSNTVGGEVDYRLTPSLSLFQQVQEYFVRALPAVSATQTPLEGETSETDSLSGVTFARAWRGLELTARYAGHLQVLGTNLGHHPATFANDLQGRVAWGDARRLRLIASGVDSRYNLVDQLGGFTTTRNLRLQAERALLLGWHLRGSVERDWLEYLNLSGDIKSNSTNFSVQMEHKRVALSAGRTTSVGAGALFPAIVSAEQWLSVPLPLSDLVATPLLNSISRVETAAASVHVRRQFDVVADFMSERDLLALSRVRFRTVDVSGRYRVGKLTIQAGYASYRIENATVAIRTGTLLNRYFVRVSRDFKVF